jgi:hypothetical protein
MTCKAITDGDKAPRNFVTGCKSRPAKPVSKLSQFCLLDGSMKQPGCAAAEACIVVILVRLGQNRKDRARRGHFKRVAKREISVHYSLFAARH